jgi:hypothetical protein
VTSRGIQRDTVAASAALAALAIPVAAVLGHVPIGLGLAAGLVVGAFNAYAVAGVLDRQVPFVAGTIIRIIFFSLAAILVAMLLRTEAWAVLLGVAAAQGVMVAASVRQGLRAR